MAGCSKKRPEVAVQEAPVMSDAQMLAQLASQIQNQVQNVYFDFDKYNDKPEMRSFVNRNAALFNQAGADRINVKVEGNCDEWGTDEYNYALGLKRAKSVKDALVANGVRADRISVVSYGESNPVCKDKSKSCDAQNRRDEVRGFY